MTRYKLFRGIFFDKRHLYFLIEHFCIEIAKFYQFFRVVLLQIYFGFGAARIRNVFFRIRILRNVSFRPDPQRWGWVWIVQHLYAVWERWHSLLCETYQSNSPIAALSVVKNNYNMSCTYRWFPLVQGYQRPTGWARSQDKRNWNTGTVTIQLFWYYNKTLKIAAFLYFS
jgi:hypothetical protein